MNDCESCKATGDFLNPKEEGGFRQRGTFVDTRERVREGETERERERETETE